MKKFITIFSLLLVISLLVTACSSNNAVAQVSKTSTNQSEEVLTSDEEIINEETPQPAEGEPPNSEDSPPMDENGQPMETPPDGVPLEGNRGEGGPGGSGGNTTDGLTTATGTITIDGESQTISNEIIEADEEDQSAIYAINAADIALEHVTVITTGNSSSNEKSSFDGLNAAVLAASGSVVNMNGGSISTSGSGANGVFATGEGSVVNLSDLTINATGGGAHGVMVTLGGDMTLTNVDVNTSGRSSAPIATDRGSGTIKVMGGTVNTSGQGSPCYYSSGVIDAQDAVCLSSGSQSVVIEGSNSVIVKDSQLTSTMEEKNGIMIYQSFSGDAEGNEGVFTMTGGSLAHTAETGPLFYITNTTGYINLSNVEVNVKSGELLRAEGTERWGKEGENGGTVYLTADTQSLIGDINADAISRVNITLKNESNLIGMINADKVAGSVRVTIYELSTWYVTGDSYVSCVIDTDGISTNTVKNIIGNGYNVYYDPASCTDLAGETYQLINQGELLPME